VSETAPKVLQDLEEYGADELLEHATIEGGYDVSDLEPPDVSLERRITTTHPTVTHRWELTVSFYLEREDNHQPYHFTLYTQEGSDQLWENREPFIPLNSSLEEVLAVLPQRWRFDGFW
jgi:hypothetical protein